jgi:hypothetical protein
MDDTLIRMENSPVQSFFRLDGTIRLERTLTPALSRPTCGDGARARRAGEGEVVARFKKLTKRWMW